MSAVLDPVIHAPVRLQICALLVPVDDAEFAFVRTQLDISDSVLSKHARALEDAGYLRIVKKTLMSRQRTWLTLTAAGRDAFRAHVAELNRMAQIAGAI